MLSVPSRQTYAFDHAADLPKEALQMLVKHEAPANVVLPFIKKASNLPRSGDKSQLWIVLYDANRVEFVLSCTQGPLGNYPIFIIPSKSSQDERRGKSIADALLPLARRLLDEVPAQRVFSVFSVARVTETFAQVFEAEARARGETAIQAIPAPYYDATFTYCTSQTLKDLSDTSCLSWSEDIAISLRPADMSHLAGIQAMCKAFSETSPPFVLDDPRAELEARLLITNQQVWVHIVQEMDKEPEIACLVATTRESDKVTAVTKVFTAEHWRGRGCAARLLHRVCQEILQKKERAVLYVGNSDELAPARKVYHKIGFQGLDGSHKQDVERWLEIGFEGTIIGYW